MARRVLPLAVAAALISALGGCSNYERARRPAWRGEAENACLAQKLIHVSAYVQPAREIDGPGICGLNHPFKVSALLDGAVRFNSIYTLDCPMIAALNAWLVEIVQPAAQARFGEPVAEIESMGAYSCRTMNNQPGARISEHGFGNAFDIGGFRLADGREISIVRDWTRGDDQTRAFLQDVHAGACGQFTTVLGPGANVFHYNHIHVDLALHGNTSYGPRRICRPFLRPSPTPEPPRDGLPNPPEIEEDVDIAQAGHPEGDVLAVHAGPGPAPSARIPEAYFAAAARVPSARAYAPVPPEPVRGALREDGAFVPEGQPADWDLPSSPGR
ncbi:MAG: extensin family protein [Methylocella sp.]